MYNYYSWWRAALYINPYRMHMLRYEILFLTVPEITGDEVEAVKELFTKSVRNVKGDLLAFDRWGKYRLAYPVKKNDYGVYYLARFDVPQEQRDELLTSIKSGFVFKFNTLVVKSVVTRLDVANGLEYKRPESLEEAPQETEGFLKAAGDDRRSFRDDRGGQKRPYKRNNFDRNETTPAPAAREESFDQDEDVE